MKRMLATATALILLTSTSEADEAFHCPKSGTVISYSDGSSLTFTDQAAMTCRARTNKGGLDAQFLGLELAGSELEKNQGERLFPFKVGNQIDFMSSGSTANATGDLVNTTKDVYYDNTIKVIGQEKVVNAAGSFDTFVIEWHRQVRGRWSGAWLTTIWFAPDIGYTIKGKFETRQGYGRDANYEIASVTLPRQEAAPVARTAPAAETQATAETIKLEQGAGTFLVPAQVNGRITLSFILDSGAADVAIPADVVQMLTRAGTISSGDFIGTKTYVLADGSKLPSEAFILHELKVGDHAIKNVNASVTPLQGKLLLGQSFLSRLPAWTIDNKQHALIIGGGAGPDHAVGAQVAAATPRTSVAAAPPAPPPAPSARSSPPPAPSASPSPAAPVPAPPIAAAAVPVARVVASAAGEISFRCPPQGTFIQYSNGTTLKFGHESGFRCAYVNQAYGDAEKFAIFADDAKFLDAGLDKLWPLRIGKEQTVGVSISSAYLTHHFTVLRNETIATAAGTFDSFVVEEEETGTGAPSSKRLFWYAPGPGLIVKSTFTLLRTGDVSARGGTSTASLVPGDYQAVRIEIPGGKPPQ